MELTKRKLMGRVKRGVKYLNAEYGRFWQRRVDTETLEMSRPDSCMLGQVEGEFGDAAENLGLSQEDAVKYGFLLVGDEDDGEEEDGNYGRLTSVWQEVVRKL